MDESDDDPLDGPQDERRPRRSSSGVRRAIEKNDGSTQPVAHVLDEGGMARLEEKLLPGRLLIVDDDYAAASALGKAHVRVLSPEAISTHKPYLIARGESELSRTLIRAPGEFGRAVDARKRLRGAYFDLDMHDGGFFRALSWFRLRYGITPIVGCSRLEPRELRALCEVRSIAFSTADELRLRLDTELLSPRGLLGVLFPPGSSPIVVVHRTALEEPEVLRHLEMRFFFPWDVRCLDVRRFAIEKAGARVGDLSEHLLRVVDAYFDGIAQCDLYVARGVESRSLATLLSDLRAILGIDHLDELTAEYQRLTGTKLLREVWNPSPRRAPSDRPRARRIF